MLHHREIASPKNLIIGFSNINVLVFVIAFAGELYHPTSMLLFPQQSITLHGLHSYYDEAHQWKQKQKNQK